MHSRVPMKYHDSVTQVLYRLCNAVAPVFHALGFRANHVTLLSIAFVLASNVLMYYGKFILAAVCAYASHVFDRLDGVMARKYSDTSSLGECLDHDVRDIFTTLRPLIMMVSPVAIGYKIFFTACYCGLVIVSMRHQNCVTEYQKTRLGGTSQKNFFCRDYEDLEAELMSRRRFGLGYAELLKTSIVAGAAFFNQLI